MGYENGKIYKIISLNTGNMYIGSTTQTLTQRYAHHRCMNNKYKLKKCNAYCTSYEVINDGKSRIKLIENFACKSQKELRAREGYFIKNLDCVNIVTPGISSHESKHKYYYNNTDKIQTYSKKYYEKNKDKIKQYQKTKMQNWKKIKNVCVCGGKYTNRHKSAHLKTKKHKNYMEKLNYAQ